MPKIKQKIVIEETAHVINDHLLDVFGNEFKFDHAKGMAEWLKNSFDAYLRTNAPEARRHIYFTFTDYGASQPTVECIDFVGMDSEQIEKAFKVWGDPNASKGGRNVRTFGGHGNGGKFYMRQMFRESYFVTYKNGLLNVFGFSSNRKYGYAKGLKDKRATVEQALEAAGISQLPITDDLRDALSNGSTGFTVVRGIGPEGVTGRFRLERDIERFRNHPQARRILLQTTVSVIYNGASIRALLKPDELLPLQNFEAGRSIAVPDTLVTRDENGMERQVSLTNSAFPTGVLTLHTSRDALTKGTKLGELNRIDFLGGSGVTIASYLLQEIDVRGFPQAAFIYGECTVPILEDPKHDCVSNDRTHLVKSETTIALLDWVATQVDGLAADIASQERANQKVTQRDITSHFNDVLNAWKNKHMQRILSEVFGSSGSGGNGGGSGGGRAGSIVTLPKNGFAFKFNQGDIAADVASRLTLKATVPEPFPVGTVISVEISDGAVADLGVAQITIMPESLKATPNGEDVAFLNIPIMGKVVGAQATVTARAGKLTAETVVTVTTSTSGGKKAFPRVLLSGHDTDPLGIAPGGILTLIERDPVVYQRPQDFVEGIYWINTESPMALAIYNMFTFDSIQWRSFLFERFVDIFVKEAVHELEKKDFENFNADSVDQKISDVIQKVHQSAKNDLSSFLFDVTYDAKQAAYASSS